MTMYAAQTSVPVEKSKAEIETILLRYGASEFVSGWGSNLAQIGFRMNGRAVRFVLPLPEQNDEEFQKTPSRGNQRSPQDAYKAWEQACRQRWRALTLCIKAKLEAVECGITTFEEEFLAHLVLPNGNTVGQWMHPQLEDLSASGKMPSRLMLEDQSRRTA